MTITHGDCLTVMPTLDAESIDAIVTDPPYGLGFMGKAWDHGVPGADFWREALRVAKPGAHLVAFGGTRTYHRLTCAIEDAGWEIRDCLSWLYGSGFPKSHNGPWGGTALKPAWEPIIVARKPLAGTVAANVAAHGTGALNIDGCRVSSEGNTTAASRPSAERSREHYRTGSTSGKVSTDIGRWPANVALDEDAAAMLDEQAPRAGGAAPASGPTLTGETGGTVAYGARQGLDRAPAFHGDIGGASRFYYVAKASRSERNAGLEGRERKPLNWSAGTQNPGAFQSANTDRTSENHHPTVKPLALMRWLCRLVTPPGGLILDPFTGSGTTGCAAALEGFRFVGIEREGEYVEIARRRITHWAAQHKPDLFTTTTEDGA